MFVSSLQLYLLNIMCKLGSLFLFLHLPNNPITSQYFFSLMFINDLLEVSFSSKLVAAQDKTVLSCFVTFDYVLKRL